MKTFMAIAVMLLSFNTFAGITMVEEKVNYQIEFAALDLPDSVRDKIVQQNINAKNDAITSAIARIDKKCIDPNWGDKSQVDVVGIKAEVIGSSLKEATYEVTVSAACRSLR